MKIVINTCFGGFGISKAAAQFMAERGSERAKLELASEGKPDGRGYPQRFYGYGYVEGMSGGYDRTDPLLVAAVEQLKGKANSDGSKLKVVTVPDGIQWEIEDYDGKESVHELHAVWE